MSLLAGVGDTRNPHSEQVPNVPGGGIFNFYDNVAVVPDELAEAPRDLAVPVRRARMRFTGQFALRPFLAVMQDEFGLFAVKKGGVRPSAAMPTGVFEVNDERNNINVPPVMSYGSIVELTPQSDTVVF